MTIELLDRSAESDTSLEDRGKQAVNACVVLEFVSQLDDTVEKLWELTQLPLTDCRKVAFSIIGEDIADGHARQLLRELYAPVRQEPVVPRKNYVLDGGLGDSR